MIFVIATIETTAGRRQDFIAEFLKLVPEVLAEEGCIEYGPTIDAETNIAAQPEQRENTVTIVEKWGKRRGPRGSPGCSAHDRVSQTCQRHGLRHFAANSRTGNGLGSRPTNVRLQSRSGPLDLHREVTKSDAD